MQPRNSLLIIKFETEPLRVGAEDLNVVELEADEPLVTARKSLRTRFSFLRRRAILLGVSVYAGTNTNGAYGKGNGRDIAAAALCRRLGREVTEALVSEGSVRKTVFLLCQLLPLSR